MYVYMYRRMAEWLEWQRSDHACDPGSNPAKVNLSGMLMGNEPSAWHLWKVPENHTTGRPKLCEGNWVDETVQKPSVVVLA